MVAQEYMQQRRTLYQGLAEAELAWPRLKFFRMSSNEHLLKVAVRVPSVINEFF